MIAVPPTRANNLSAKTISVAEVFNTAMTADGAKQKKYFSAEDRAYIKNQIDNFKQHAHTIEAWKTDNENYNNYFQGYIREISSFKKRLDNVSKYNNQETLTTDDAGSFIFSLDYPIYEIEYAIDELTETQGLIKTKDEYAKQVAKEIADLKALKSQLLEFRHNILLKVANNENLLIDLSKEFDNTYQEFFKSQDLYDKVMAVNNPDVKKAMQWFIDLYKKQARPGISDPQSESRAHDKKEFFTAAEKNYLDKQISYFRRHAYTIQPWRIDKQHYNNIFDIYKDYIESINKKLNKISEYNNRSLLSANDIGYLMFDLREMADYVEYSIEHLSEAQRFFKTSASYNNQVSKEIVNLQFLKKQVDQLQYKFYSEVADKKELLIDLSRQFDNVFQVFFDYPDLYRKVIAVDNPGVKKAIQFFIDTFTKQGRRIPT
jgi:uncharacterized protein involved in tolerance to divalent cations